MVLLTLRDGRIHLEDWMSVIESINMDLSEEASHAVAPSLFACFVDCACQLFQFLDRDGDGFIEALVHMTVFILRS